MLVGMRPLPVLLLLAAQAEEPLRTAWGRIEWKPDAAVLVVDAWPADGRVALPRLHNPIGRVYLQSDPKTPLALQPGVAGWAIAKPKDGGSPLVVETVGKPRVAGAEAPLVEPEADGSIRLPAHLAQPRGKQLRYEPQPHKNTIGYWTDESDWVEWRLRVPKAGKYAVLVLQGCGKGHGGSVVKVSVAGRALDYTVEDSGGFQNFVERRAGVVEIAAAGPATFEIRAVKKVKGAVMDVREARLVPE
jgi:hypothetical protein